MSLDCEQVVLGERLRSREHLQDGVSGPGGEGEGRGRRRVRGQAGRPESEREAGHRRAASHRVGASVWRPVLQLHQPEHGTKLRQLLQVTASRPEQTQTPLF